MFDSEESRNRLITKFKTETNKHLLKLRNYLLQLETTPEDGEVLEQVFMLAHTIKGNLGMMLLLDEEFAKLNPYVQKLEYVAIELHNRNIRLEPALMQEFYENIGQIECNFTQVA